MQEISFIKTVRSFLIGAFESEVRDLLLYIHAKEKGNLKIILNWALIRQKPLIKSDTVDNSKKKFESRSVYFNGSLYCADPSYTENFEIDLMSRDHVTLVK